jgi:hypothetical protein
METLTPKLVHDWLVQLPLTGLLLAVACSVSASQALPVYPGAELIETSNSDSDRYRIVLSSLKKIRNVLQPDRIITVNGRSSARTYYVPDEIDVEVLIAHYKGSTTGAFETLFSCQGRDCGSSNYWANTVFKNRILYGPEQFQYYWVGLNSETQNYELVYLGRRGTRKIYVHHEIIVTEDSAKARDNTPVLFDGAGIVRLSLQQVASDLDGLAELLQRYLNKAADQKMAIVVHDAQQRTETLVQAINRTTSEADLIRQQLIRKGLPEGRLSAHGAGPLGPVEDLKYPRVDMVLLPH